MDDLSEHEITLRSSSDGLAAEIAILRISTVSIIRRDYETAQRSAHATKI
ncbi:hypothetical protein J2129_002624 [Methanofollis sp. W23]|nr:hypothetical protein [Methanofollis sp. W23]MBP2147170.1 hypothetical protein [Methanofollis sp. W23]